jgi:tetratricopeptide (TPR) repeat protein
MDVDSLIERGKELLQEREFKRAISLFTKAIVKAPREAQAYCRRAEAYYGLLHFPARRPPADTDRYEEFELRVRDRKELKLALQDLHRALKISPDYAEAHFGKGVIEYEMGRYKEALRCFSKAIAIEEDVPESYYRRAMVHERLGNDAGALADLDSLIEIAPDYADAYLERSVIYSSQEKYAKALVEIDKAIELSPDSAPYHVHKAMTISMPAFDSMDKVALEAARDSLSEAIRLDPEYPAAYYHRSVLNGLLDDPEAELADLNEAIRLDPDYTAAYRSRFDSLTQMGRKAEAAADWAQYCLRTKASERLSTISPQELTKSVN